MSEEAVRRFKDGEVLGWVLIEFRAEATPDQPGLRKAALLKRDGAIVDSSRLAALELAGVPSGNYWLSLFSPGHLRIHSSRTIRLGEERTINYDFTLPENIKGNSSNFSLISGKVHLSSGDVNQDGVVDASDSAEVDHLIALFSCGYLPSADFNIDGFVDFVDQVMLENNSHFFRRQAP